MTRRKILLLAILAAMVAGIAWPGHDAWSPVTAVGRDGKLAFPNVRGARRTAPPKRTVVAPEASARVEAWLAAHPPSPALRDALLDVAERADAIEQPLPTAAPEDDAAARALEAARDQRTKRLDEFRTLLRSTLRGMTAGERAALRAANVHIIQLARHVAERG